MEDSGAHRRRPAAIDRPSLESILSDIEDPLCRWLPDGTLVFVNQAYCRMLGGVPETLLGRRIAELGPDAAETEALSATILAALSPSAPTFACEHRHRGQDTERWLQWINRGLFDAAGRLVGVQSVGRDITSYRQAIARLQESEARYRARAESSWDLHERRAIEAALRASEAQLRAMVENVPDYVAVIDRDGVIRFLNHATPGTRAAAAIGRRFESFAPPENRRLLREAFARCLAGGGVQTLEVHRRAPRGAPVWYAARMVPMLQDGAAISVLLIATDVTAQRDREATLLRFNAELEERVADRTAELQASLRELEAFSYSVSHDLRAPLRAIDGFSKALVEDHAAALGAEGMHYLQRVRLAAQRMGQLIDDLLRLARAMRSELSVGVVPLGSMAREIAADLRREQPEREVEFRIDERATAQGDPVLLRAALTNLLANAWKFTRQRARATIEFASEYRADGRVFVVRDDGVGFDMTYAAKLFRPFERLHATDFEGSGIGLAIVQRIVSRHGGWIWAEGAVGRGAAFYFTLPEASRSAAAKG